MITASTRIRWPFQALLTHWCWRDATSHEERLIASAKHGDPQAFDVLVSLYAPKLHAVARQMVGDDRAADVVQDSLLAAFRAVPRFRGEASFSTWLHSILINRCRHVIRKAQVQLVPLEDYEPADERANPELQVESEQLQDSVRRALKKLPAPYREALSLREFSELSYEEISSVLGISIGTVKSRLARARGLLREALVREGLGL